jgi:peptidoglycan hydrolase-like protein with peptidoglycan-binding domain
MNALQDSLFEHDLEFEDYEDYELWASDPELDLEWDELDLSHQELEAEAEIGRRSRMPFRPVPRSPRPRMQGAARRTPAHRPKPRRLIRRHPRSVFVHEPATCVCPEITCPRHGTEYIRWVQNTLNDVLGLRLPVNGIIGRETRSAVRSFQERHGLPVTGIVGPDIESALIAARGGKLPRAEAAKTAEPGMPEPAQPATTSPEPDSAKPASEFDLEWGGTYEPEIATLDELVGDFEHQPTPWGPTPGTEWPRGRTFKPNAPSIPSGPYPLTQTSKCSVVADVDQLSIEIQRFEKLIQELRRRRNESVSPQLEEMRSKAKHKFNDITTLINVIIADVKNGTYRRGGCGDRDFAVATCKMRMLGGLWCKSPPLKKARCKLVFLLRNSRGTFANVWCTKLGVPLAKDWCKGHTCCCPGVG